LARDISYALASVGPRFWLRGILPAIVGLHFWLRGILPAIALLGLLLQFVGFPPAGLCSEDRLPKHLSGLQTLGRLFDEVACLAWGAYGLRLLLQGFSPVYELVSLS